MKWRVRVGNRTLALVDSKEAADNYVRMFQVAWHFSPGFLSVKEVT